MAALTINLGLKPWQKDVFEYVKANNKGKIVTLRSGRQRGKTRLISAILSYVSLTYENSESFLLSPTQEQAQIICKTISQALDDTGLITMNNGVMIRFVNGSRIYFKSAAQGIRGLQGYTCKGHGILVIDEAGYIPDNILNEVWPYCNVNNGTIFLSSTPNQKTGKFYELSQLGETGKDKNVRGFFWSMTQYDFSEFLSPERLQYYADTLSPVDYTRLILGEYADAELSAFTGFESVLTTVGDCQPTSWNYAGIDWSSGLLQDFTVVTIYNQLGQMVKLERWNQLPPKETVTKVAEILKANNVRYCLAEQNSIGHVYIDYLKEAVRGCPIHVDAFETTYSSKKDLVDEMRVAISRSQVTLLRIPELIEEFSLFCAQETPSGRITYSVPESLGHDDVVLSCLIGLHCVNQHRKNNRNHGMFL